ncbi:DUF5686 and carboxypeptidase regulatory-like domain-containing protein [Pedobacter alpinus]|uniref:DUF5686 and carboxypeptidase regulatory-like domain-containing protein n=1 Tax=Pedobacter alpinus TaxID=1590643 RepID=A0ABW5TN86_9SPHI
MYKRYLVLILIIFSFDINAQSIIGNVANKEKEPIPFATVAVKGSNIGTSANNEGNYFLKLANGNYEVIISAVGYKQAIKSIIVNANNMVLNFQLEPELYELKDVIVNATGKDPAYAIIKKAINKRKGHLTETPAYTCKVYIKGVQKLLKAPEKFLGRDIGEVAKQAGLDSNRTGIVYQSESQSILNYLPPNNYQEEMISSKVAGSNRAFSFNRATELLLNFYENYQNWDGISNRPFVSPIADNALFYYDYKLIGSTLENGELINKIQLIPKRKYDPAYRGYIYIVENSWRIHSTDFLMTKESNITLIDSLKINQKFIPIKQNWMPASVAFEFKGGLFSFKFGGYFLGIYTDYDFKPTKPIKNFKEVLKITKDVNKKDDEYWSNERPIPLTKEEKVNYVKKDSIAKKRESKPYLDSLDKVNNKLKFSKIFLGGYQPRNRFKKEYYNFDGLLSSVHFNTVEGFAINYGASYSKRIDTINNRNFTWNGHLRYGFSNKLFSANTGFTIPILKKQSLSFLLGSDVVDLNNNGSINILGNTFNSLFFEKNYMKLYRKQLVQVGFNSQIAGGLNGSLTLFYNDNNWLANTTTYKFIDDKEIEFTSNNPFQPLSSQPLFVQHQTFKAKISLRYNFSNKYVTYPTGRFYLPSKWPVLNFNYIKAIPNIFGSDTDFDQLSLRISKPNIKFGFYGKFSFATEAGAFINTNNIFYPDFKHFTGNKALAFTPADNQFLFLDFYKFNTANKYFEAHLEHNFSGFFSNKIPLVRKLKLQELVGINYLASNELTNYRELYVGLAFTGLKVYYGFVYNRKEKIDSGFRIAYGF